MSHNPRLTTKNSSILTQENKTGTLTPTTYSYDRSKNLTSIVKPSGKTITNTYNNGNRASATVNGTSITASYTLDDNLVVYGDNSYLYDDDGYLKTKTTPSGTTTYSYGTRGELLSVTTPTKTITYKHNALNQRVAKLINGQVVEKYLWANLTTLLAVYDSSDNLLQRFEYADQRMPVAMTKGADKFYLHYDQVGSLRAVTDSSHNIVKEITYDTYGNILSDSNLSFTIPFGFAGGLYDADTKLTRFGYRDYDAYTGKWTAKDPIGFSGGDSNLYGYVLGDPVNWVDESGLSGALPWSTTITLPSLEWRLFYEAAKLGYQTGYDLAEWWDNYNDSSVMDDYVCKAKDSKKSGKDRATDIPSWAKGERPLAGESGNDFAERLLNKKYGPGNWKKGPKTEHNKLRKNGDRR